MTTPNTYVNHIFPKGFLLKEEDIVKIIDIISQRTSSLSNNELIIIVYRKDGLIYKTGNLSLVRDQENAERNKITGMSFKVESDQLKLDLSFFKRKGASISIEAMDRDLGYLIYSEIKEYINTEVMTLREAKSDSFKLILPLIILSSALIPLILISVMSSIDSLPPGIMESGDINRKLNYLLSKTQRSETVYLKYGLIPVVVTPLIGFLYSPICKYLFPSNIFYLGKEKIWYDSLIARRSRWNWGILISSIISIITGVVVYWITEH